MLCNVHIRSQPLNEQQEQITLLEGGKLWFSPLNGEGLEPIVLPWKCHSGHMMELCDECNNCNEFQFLDRKSWERFNFLWFYTILSTLWRPQSSNLHKSKSWITAMYYYWSHLLLKCDCKLHSPPRLALLYVGCVFNFLLNLNIEIKWWWCDGSSSSLLPM